MLTLQMLPAGNGDCLWLEYGPPDATRIVLIDGGVKTTIDALERRIESACRARGTSSIDIELLVVTHIDNDHVEGIIELLKSPRSNVNIKDIWFNGRPQLVKLPPPEPGDTRRTGSKRKRRSNRPADLMGSSGEDDEDSAEDGDGIDEEGAPFGGSGLQPSPEDLLGYAESDALSELIATHGLPCNTHSAWNGSAIALPDAGNLPVASLEGGLTLTLLGPTFPRLHDLCAGWSDVLGGIDELPGSGGAVPADLLGRSDTWPPTWKRREQRDSSVANGSSIMLLAEYGKEALLLAADGHAPDLAAALDRLCRERNIASSRLPLAAFKISHHGSHRNISQAVIDKTDCTRYLVSTNGIGHRHPDHQALLRVLRYSNPTPHLLFNYDVDTTRPWRDAKADVLSQGFQNYETGFPENPDDGLIV